MTSWSSGEIITAAKMNLHEFYENKNLASGYAGLNGSSTIGLSQFSINSPIDGNVLGYDGSKTIWTNRLVSSDIVTFGHATSGNLNSHITAGGTGEAHNIKAFTAPTAADAILVSHSSLDFQVQWIAPSTLRIHNDTGFTVSFGKYLNGVRTSGTISVGGVNNTTMGFNDDFLMYVSDLSYTKIEAFLRGRITGRYTYT